MLRSLFASLRSRRPDARAQPVPAARARDAVIGFVTTTPERRTLTPHDAGTADYASARLRVLIPAAQLARRGDATVQLVPLEMLRDARLLDGEPRITHLVLGKMAAGFVQANETLFRSVLGTLSGLRGKIRVVADVSDDYAALGDALGAPFLRSYQAALLESFDIVVSCEALRTRFAHAARGAVTVVEDPYENPAARAPRTRASEPLRLCWFGTLGDANLEMVASRLEALARGMRGSALQLEMVSHPARRALVEALAARLAQANAGMDVRFTDWSLESTWAAIERCDFVVLPQDPLDPAGQVKSHNRLVEAIRGGRLAIASPIPSYRELADFAWLGEDFAQGLRWALAHPDDARARVAAGQSAIEARFAPAVVGAKWARALQLPEAASGAVDHGAMRRLNLGCGDKILAGYVNVDVAASRAGRSPDVLCDLHRLEPFADDSCDEVMAIHVVEHFYRWEVVDVLREWLRVLKPGGRMILECPNLLTACQTLLDNPQLAAGAGPEGQRSMWVFYGDPAWRDPLMCHRWNYTPDSLRAVMQEAGLVNVHQAPAQFKLREPRDMRLVGEKPAAGD
ncbi:MAG: methyltransferase domain-containing protein [Burkholderiales bacterium]|nr:methyltransferase domain-containing protein [Burkholderiales bacterium]